jgi:hypothetical protein
MTVDWKNYGEKSWKSMEKLLKAFVSTGTGLQHVPMAISYYPLHYFRHIPYMRLYISSRQNSLWINIKFSASTGNNMRLIMLQQCIFVGILLSVSSDCFSFDL